MALTICHNQIVGPGQGRAVANFFNQIRGLLATPHARLSTLGVSLFWAAATVLRYYGITRGLGSSGIVH